MNPSTSGRSSAEPQGSRPATAEAQAQIDSAQLLRGQTAVSIMHNGAIYRLQTTRQGKLILTK